MPSFTKGKLLGRGHSREMEEEFCVLFGFCGEECREIIRQLEQSGKCTLVL